MCNIDLVNPQFLLPGGGCASTIPSKKTFAPSSTALPSILTVNFGTHTGLGLIVYALPVNGPYNKKNMHNVM